MQVSSDPQKEPEKLMAEVDYYPVGTYLKLVNLRIEYRQSTKTNKLTNVTTTTDNHNAHADQVQPCHPMADWPLDWDPTTDSLEAMIPDAVWGATVSPTTGLLQNTRPTDNNALSLCVQMAAKRQRQLTVGEQLRQAQATASGGYALGMPLLFYIPDDQQTFREAAIWKDKKVWMLPRLI